MKYAVVILVVLLGVWLWRKNRADDRSETPAKPPRKDAAPIGAPQMMVSCAVCGVHLPQSDALPTTAVWRIAKNENLDARGHKPLQRLARFQFCCVAGFGFIRS
jgi:uncharacterized protein